VKPGRVALVGAGPGDPGLLTVRGAECLAEADLVLHDSLVDPRVLRRVRAGAEIVNVGKHGDAGNRDAEQAAIHERMVDAALAGKTVVRLKGGDPFLFGRGGEEAEVLAEAGIPFEVVPGVTSAIAVPAYAGIPLTHRGLASGAVIVTGHEAPGGASAIDWKALAQIDTVVVLMARKRLPEVVGRLVAAGRAAETPAAIVHRGTTGAQRVVVASLGRLVDAVERAEVGTPSLLIVGEVVRLRERIAWFEQRPLLGRRIVVTRPRAQSVKLIERLERLGAEAIEAPAIEVTPLERTEALDGALRELATFGWIVFTSRNGVEAFFRRLFESGRDARAVAGARLAAIGSATAEALVVYGLRADLVPDDFDAEGLSSRLASEVAGRRVLLPRAGGGRDVLPRELAAAGADVVDAPMYRSVRAASLPPAALEMLRRGAIDAVTFTSGSTAENFWALLDDDARRAFAGVAAASIGPVTSATLRRLGISVAVEARRADAEGLVEALVDSLGGGR
jgi:uroporphyrinogen III methyltransferase / synthase